MNPRKVSDLKVQFLGITPVLSTKKGFLNTQEIVALSALVTFKGKTIKNLLKDILDKGESLNERVKKVLQKSVLRGHASLATTPSICITYEGSKFIDSSLTGIVFSSSLVSSGRRTDTEIGDIVFPNGILANSRAKLIYQKVSKNIIIFFNWLLKNGVPKEEAAKILQYGIYGTGIIQLPVESIIGLKKEYQREKDWFPKEIGFLLKKIERETKKMGIETLYSMREVAPRNVYPYPNIFKDPRKSNLTREIIGKNRNLPRIISNEIIISTELNKKLRQLSLGRKKTFSSLQKIKESWFNILIAAGIPKLRFAIENQDIFRDYNLSLRIKMASSVAWRVWGEKKRHRTCPQTVDSVYFCIDRTEKKFKQFGSAIERGAIDNQIINTICKFFSVPPSIIKNSQFLSKYLALGNQAFKAYRQLIDLGIKPNEAIYIIPRALKIDVIQEFDLYNLLTGYYPLRLCQTAEEEIKKTSLQEILLIKKLLLKKNYRELISLLVPKCGLIGFCPEEKSCGYIKSIVKDYNDTFHQEMKEVLKSGFEQNLKSIGK